MMDPINFPINPKLWKNSVNAQSDDKWKWADSIWVPVIEKIISSDENEVHEMICPICGERKLYSFFIAFRLSARSEKMQKGILLGDRWFGCQNCQVQIHDYGELPKWEILETARWASEEAMEDTRKIIRELNISGHSS